MSPLAFSRRSALVGAAVGLVASAPARADPQTLAGELDALFQSLVAGPGDVGAIAAVVKEGEPVFARGYGVRELGGTARVGDRTLFGIGSCAKAFTSASLAVLADEGALSWDDPVVKHLPEFALSDPRVTEAFTIRDLLLHNSGLALGAGDLMIWPLTTHTRAEIVAGLRHLPLVRPFRSGYAYDNVLYVAAGEVIARLRGEPLEVVLEAFLARAGFRDATPRVSTARRSGDFARYHARYGGEARGEGALRVLPPLPDAIGNDLAAGGLMFSARDLARWMQIQLGRGALPEGGRLWSEAQHDMMWRPGVVISVKDGPTPENPARSNFDTYALGWQVSDYRGRRMIWHGGYGPGNLSVVALLPGAGVGVAISVNSEESLVGRNSALDLAIGVGDVDWVARARSRPADARPGPRPGPAKEATPPSRPLEAYAGLYRDAWYGEVTVGHDAEGLTIDFTKTPGMRGRLEPWGGESFRTWFEDRSMEDALAVFDVGAGGEARMAMKAFSPDADFSYDFHDLKLVRVG